MRPTKPRPSYARIVHKIGAVTPEALRRARVRRDRQGGTLEEHLVALGALAPALAAFAREAWERARATCERCARRTDLELRGERACRCPRGMPADLRAGA